MDGRKRFEYTRCGGTFFLKAGGKRSLICFQKYPGMCGRGPRHFHVVVVQNGEM